jgi:cytoskeletal protein CcmA (bactofilin family)
MGYDGEQTQRGVADLGRSMLKSVTNFSKIKSDEPTAAEPATTPQAAPLPVGMPVPANDATVISLNVEMAGTIVTPDVLHIAGRIEGNVRASSITVRASGVIKGDLVAETVIVHGTVDGRIFGQKVQLAAGAIVRGDIMHGALGIDPEATFEGASKRNSNAMSDAPVFSVKAA